MNRLTIQPGVQEAKRLLSALDARIIQQAHQRGKRRRRRRRAANLDQPALGIDTKIPALRRDVREPAPLRVV